MSNLKKQLTDIRQQFVVSTAETVARFQKVEAHMADLRTAVEEQGKVQVAAIDSLIDLVVQHGQQD